MLILFLWYHTNLPCHILPYAIMPYQILPHDKITKEWKKRNREKCNIRSYDNISHDMTKPTKWMCAQRRLRSAWASAQSDQSLRCPHEESWADAQADLSLRRAHSHFVGFVMSRPLLKVLTSHQTFISFLSLNLNCHVTTYMMMLSKFWIVYNTIIKYLVKIAVWAVRNMYETVSFEGIKTSNSSPCHIE